MKGSPQKKEMKKISKTIVCSIKAKNLTFSDEA
jgi:hypothetical protein